MGGNGNVYNFKILNMNLKNWIIKKLGGFTKSEVSYMVKNFPIRNSHPETVFYGTSYSKLPKDITQEDLNNWYKHESNKEKTCKKD